MNAKRKLMLGVASLGVLVILAGTALGIALAALTGTVNSGFSITYTAHNVNAAIIGLYDMAPMYDFDGNFGVWYGSTGWLNGPDEIVSDMGVTGISFNDSTQISTKNFESISLEIPAPALNLNYFVVFEYVVINLDNNDISLKLSVEGEIDDNIEISYLVTNDYNNDIQTKIDAFNNRDDIKAKLDTLNSYLDENGGEGCYDMVAGTSSDSIGYLLCAPEKVIKGITGHHLQNYNLIKQNKEMTELVGEIVAEYNSLYAFSNTLPSNTTIQTKGHSWEDDLVDLYLNHELSHVFIKVALKDSSVSVEDFSASFKFDLTPAV